MYVPRLHAMPGRADALALMHAHPLATWITAAGGELQAHHLPTLLQPDHGARPTHRPTARARYGACASSPG